MTNTFNESNENTVILQNKLLENVQDDMLYHFGISKSDVETVSKFSSVKFVCTGGSVSRITKFALLFAKTYNVPLNSNSSNSDRYAMFLTGNVLWINHGIGVPSLSVLLIEIFKLLHYANASNVKFIRLGTSGGIGVDPGDIIISTAGINGLLKQKFNQYVYGKLVEYDTFLDKNLGDELYETAVKLNLPVVRGLTFCADDFYESQMRLDGFFCNFNVEDKENFLLKLNNLGVKNIEMESTGFAAYTYRAKIPAAIICVALINRLATDQVVLNKNTYAEFEMRLFHVVSTYINNQCNLNIQKE